MAGTQAPYGPIIQIRRTGTGGNTWSTRCAAPGSDLVIDARVCDCCPTAAVRTGRGAIVAYRDRSDVEVRDFSIARLVDGSWQAGGSVHPDGWEINGCPVNGPAPECRRTRFARPR